MDIIGKPMLWPLEWYQDRPSTLINDRDIGKTVHTAKTCTSKLAPQNMHPAVCSTKPLHYFYSKCPKRPIITHYVKYAKLSIIMSKVLFVIHNAKSALFYSIKVYWSSISVDWVFTGAFWVYIFVYTFGYVL